MNGDRADLVAHLCSLLEWRGDFEGARRARGLDQDNLRAFADLATLCLHKGQADAATVARCLSCHDGYSGHEANDHSHAIITLPGVMEVWGRGERPESPLLLHFTKKRIPWQVLEKLAEQQKLKCQLSSTSSKRPAEIRAMSSKVESGFETTPAASFLV